MGLKNKFFSNLSFAFVAQFISMIISLATNLILPKFLGVDNYSYWQLFIFYSQYIPFLHLGLNDGVYLRYGGKSFETIDKAKIKTQLLLGILYQLFFCVILCIVSWIAVDSSSRYAIILLSCVYFLFFTIQNYLGYIFQATNETSWYSKATILNRILFLAIMSFCIIVGSENCWPYIIAYIISQFVSVLYSCYKGKTILTAPLISFKMGVYETKESIRGGIKLMLANIASMLILGCGRQIIDMKWGITTFGRVSFSITLTNFILTFIQQVGMVMFPMLRRLGEDKQKEIYELCRLGLFFALPIVFLIYFPAKTFLGMWLPDYTESLQYLALMLPICFFDTKTQMLCNTYLKVWRKEKILFLINLVSMLTSFLVGAIGAYVIESLYVVVLGMVFAIALRSGISEFYLSRKMSINIKMNYIQELLLVVLFMLTAWNMGTLNGFCILFIFYIILLIVNQKSLRAFIKKCHSLYKI